MTGLDFNEHHIMEAACLVTDSELNVVGEGVDLIINQPDSVLNSMNDWCKEHHGKVSFIFLHMLCYIAILYIFLPFSSLD